ncbi:MULTISPECIES: GIY-YIG nuclease family protein [Heyndrickxia]|uniref:GIY-YIG nuclease family protein n=1 Tax=Heyndrickxia TaxID=2837504 RepID=UPI002DBF967D|nr:GIY-YIG nuclease family protein [Weizmannia sp. CD-2023]MEC2304532.1 GIY-YIG nuclease family protein [Weizmannia sp. CD-2023]MEC2341643.1 GIY-YIG nuclease family protein [Weizmannia sp. CD-2023]
METKTKSYFYVLLCCDGSFYGGYTVDLKRRFREHSEGRGAKYTRTRTPVKLLYFQEYTTKSEAMKAEYAFKKLSRRGKERFLEKAGVDLAQAAKFPG